MAPLSRSTVRHAAWGVFVASALVLVFAVAVLRLPAGQLPLLVPVVLAFVGAGLALLSMRARERAERAERAGD